MTKDQFPSSEGENTHFRSLRRRSEPRGREADIVNIFDSEVSEPASDKAGPAHVETSEQQTGRLRALLAPKDCPEVLTKALAEKVRKLDEFCSAAYLFQAAYDSGEPALMICLCDVEASTQARVEGAIADALMASGHEDHALGILFLAGSDSKIEHITRIALVLKGKG